MLKYFTTMDIFRSSEKLRSPVAMVWRPSSFVVRHVASVNIFFSITTISIFTSLIGCFMGPGGQGACKIGIFLLKSFSLLLDIYLNNCKIVNFMIPTAEVVVLRCDHICHIVNIHDFCKSLLLISWT